MNAPSKLRSKFLPSFWANLLLARLLLAREP